MTDRPEHLTIFLENMPRDYLAGALRTLFDCYEASEDQCDATFQRSEAVNLIPFYRRAMIEQQLREVAGSFPGIRAEARRSPSSGWNHTLVLSGRAALTENAVGHPDGLVRPSLFRMMYAGKDNQQYLFPEMQPLPSPPDSIVYGILIHGHSESCVLPCFAKIVFPREDLQSNLPGEIDLFREFPEIVRARTVGAFEDQDGIEQVAEPKPQLRTDSMRASEGA